MSDIRFDDATWEDRFFGYGVLKIKAGHWCDRVDRVFTELMRGNNVWLGRSPGTHWSPISPTHDQICLYMRRLSVDKTLQVAATGFDEKETMSRLPTPAAPIQTQQVPPVGNLPSVAKQTSARTISVTAFCRLSTEGILLKPKGATDSNFYRRNEHGAIQWFDANAVFASPDDKWCATAHQTEADEALTAAGWPPGLEIESIAGPYVPTPLEGRWTRFYWRTVETVVLWAKTARWVCTGAR